MTPWGDERDKNERCSLPAAHGVEYPEAGGPVGGGGCGSQAGKRRRHGQTGQLADGKHPLRAA